MFQKKISNEEATIVALSQACKCFREVDWEYHKTDGGAGKFFIDRCIENLQFLKVVTKIVGKGLIEGTEGAKNASLLLEHLYNHGLKVESYKIVIQNSFMKILSAASVNVLDNMTMDDWLKAIYTDAAKHDKELGATLASQAQTR